MSGDLQFITPRWPAPQGVRAAFTLRMGGVSVGPYDSLNLGAGIGDSVDAVEENRRRVRTKLRLPDEPVWLEQVHGVEVVEIGHDGALAAVGDGHGSPPKADSSVTRVAGRVCAIRVADCMPVLFAARDGSAVGAAHCGWRGLAAGVLEATIRRIGIPASELIAWMGPAIGPDHFEVGDDVRTGFLARDEDTYTAFVANARGRWQCDLYALARRNLAALGIEEIFGGGWCTFSEADRFFSYRRDGQCGRMAALIWRESPGG
jgi:YfiH family protein